ncbi:hypothetical protein ACRBEV_32530 [Methylobacterium phyllosphaerae]
MTSMIVPFRRKSDETSALARFDVIAAELLAEGRAGALSEARLVAILAELRQNRVYLCTTIADQVRIEIDGHPQSRRLAANIRAIAGLALAKLDELIELTEQRLGAE